MKITVESTSKIVEMDGLPTRIWEGTTDTGIKVHCYITRVAISLDEGKAAKDQFETELKACRAPSPEIQAIPLRLY